MKSRINWKYTLLALAWMVMIFVLSAQTKQTIPAFGTWDILVKKGGHLFEYAVLVWLWHNALNRRLAGGAWGLAVLYAISDEFHQQFTPGRHARWLDIGIDTLGATLGLYITLYVEHRLRLAGRALLQPLIALFGK